MGTAPVSMLPLVQQVPPTPAAPVGVTQGKQQPWEDFLLDPVYICLGRAQQGLGEQLRQTRNARLLLLLRIHKDKVVTPAKAASSAHDAQSFPGAASAPP